jgi:hypothetical protein
LATFRKAQKADHRWGPLEALRDPLGPWGDARSAPPKEDELGLTIPALIILCSQASVISAIEETIVRRPSGFLMGLTHFIPGEMVETQRSRAAILGAVMQMDAH